MLMKPPVVMPKQYQITQQELGAGTYGSVKLAYDRKNHRSVAIKIINKNQMRKIGSEKHVKNEIHLMQELQHKHIVKYYEHYEDFENIYIVMEYCQNGTLFTLMKKKGKLTEEEAFPYFHQIVLALKYLHDKDIAHRDLKADNVLLGDNIIKVCDFNWSIRLNGGKAPPNLCGTTEYMPPEVVKKQPHDTGVDIWSLGVLLHYMLHGELLFKCSDRSKLPDKICNENNIKFNDSLSPSVRYLLSQLLSHNNNKRININQVLNCQWMKMIQIQKKMSLPYELTPVKNRSSAYEQNRFSMNSLSTNHSIGKVIQISTQSKTPLLVQTPAFDQKVLAFRVDRK